MGHQLTSNDVRKDQVVLVALARDEGCFLNQRFPEIPHEHPFWIGGLVSKKTPQAISVEIKPFRDLATLDLDYAMAGNQLTIPTDNIEKILSFSGSIWILLKG